MRVQELKLSKALIAALQRALQSEYDVTGNIVMSLLIKAATVEDDAENEEFSLAGYTVTALGLRDEDATAEG